MKNQPTTKPNALTVCTRFFGISFVMSLTLFAATVAQPAGPDPVDLGTAGDFVILAKTGISTVPASAVTGDVGLSPYATSYITGFDLTDEGTFATSPQVTGKVYAADMADPTPSNLTTAVSDMETAFTDAEERPDPDFTELHEGALGGETLEPGLYKWGTNVTADSDFTITGGEDDVWIFQIAGDLTLASDINVTLSGGAQAQNIFWQVSGEVNIGTGAHFEGIILSQTTINLLTGASMNGRLLAQSAVTLDQNTVTGPSPASVVWDFEDGELGDWTAGEGTASIEVSDEQAYEGDNSLKLVKDTDGVELNLYNNNVDWVQEGAEVSMMVWISQAHLDALDGLRVFYMDADWVWEDEWIDAANLTGDEWNEVGTVIGEINEPMNSVGLQVLFQDGEEALEGEIYVDLITMEELAETETIAAFNLLDPADGTTLVLDGDAATETTIDWQTAASDFTVEYVWHFDMDGDFTDPLLSIPAGETSELTLSYAAIYQALQSVVDKELEEGDVFAGEWTVTAEAGSEVVQAEQIWGITFEIGDLVTDIADFALLTPEDNADIHVEGIVDAEVDIVWEAGESVIDPTYTWYLNTADDFDGDVLASMPSNYDGQDTVLTLTLADIDAILEDAEVEVGDDIALFWTVKATGINMGKFAEASFTLNLERGIVAEAIDYVPVSDIGDLRPLDDDTVVVVKGIVNSTDFGWSVGDYFLQDETGGMNITDFDEGGARDGQVIEPGDSLRILGRLDTHENQRNLVVNEFEILSRDNPLPDPVVIDGSEVREDSPYQGTRIQLRNLYVVEEDLDSWPVDMIDTGSGVNIRVTSHVEADTFVVRLARNNTYFSDGTPVPEGYFHVTGTLSQFRETTQIFPFFEGDIEEVELFSVNFNVDMTDADFDPDVKDVYITGEMAGWAEPGSDPNYMLAPKDDNENIYTITFHLEEGDYEYKYFLVEDEPDWDDGEWAGDPNRVVSVTEDMEVNDTWGEQPTSVEELAEAPKEFGLDQNYPNPFNPVTNIRYQVPQTAHVTIEIYNVTGQLVATLVNETRDAGQHEITFDGTRLASGVYIYRMQAGSFTQTKKLMLIK